MEVSGSVTVIVVPPTDTLVASPSLPEALLTVATPVFEEVHVAKDVRSCVELSV